MTDSCNFLQDNHNGWVQENAKKSIGVSDIGVVVVTFQSATTIERCLKQLLKAIGVGRIIVIDNASDDDTTVRVENIAQCDPRVRVVHNKVNCGFGEACNQGARALDTPWVAFVNPDCYVEADALFRLAQHGLQRVGSGVLGVDLIDEAGFEDPAARRRDPSLRELLGQAGRRDDLYLGRNPKLDLQQVEALSGALMLMPLELFLQLGGFDESYALHVEDLDLCRRVREAGYEVLVANDITVTHVRGVSSRARPLWVEWQKHRSLWRYFLKFEAEHTPLVLQGILWLGLWSHFLVEVPGILLRREVS